MPMTSHRASWGNKLFHNMHVNWAWIGTLSWHWGSKSNLVLIQIKNFFFLSCSAGKLVARCSSGELVWHHLDGGCALGRLSHCFWQQRNQAEWQVRSLLLLNPVFILSLEMETQACRKWVNGVLLLLFLGLSVLTLSIGWSINLLGFLWAQ